MQWGQEEHGRSYYTPLEKASKKADHIRPFFLSQCLPTLDNLRNFFLTPTPEALSFCNILRKAPQICRSARVANVGA